MMAFQQTFNLFCDCWKLYRKYVLKDLNDVAINEYIQESGNLMEKYKNNIFAKDMIVAITSEIERRIRWRD